MFNSLSDRLTATFKNLRGKGRLLRGGHRRRRPREIRRALLRRAWPCPWCGSPRSSRSARSARRSPER
ncbi:hypothetical protein QJS66_01045 [Kocuria rhizophila]|nr:hypothetical protein QJS66_01045 [Kocuria rhizophila]